MINLVALIFLALNGVVDHEPTRLVNSMFTFDTKEACEEFKASEIGLRAEALLNLRVVALLGASGAEGVTLHEIVIRCEDAAPKRDA